MSSSQDRTAEKDLSTISNAVKQLLARLKNPAEKDSASHLQSLAQYPEIFARLVSYSEDLTNDHRITLRSFSRVKEDDIYKMGVTIRDIPFQSLAQTIPQLLDDYDLLDFLKPLCSTAVSKSAGDRAFDSQAESRARVGIHQIMSGIINVLRERKVFLVEDHVTVARLRSKVPPIELQHKSDGAVHSYFLTGVLDFLCCSSSVDELPVQLETLQTGFTAWENNSTAPPNATWKSINAFLQYVEHRAQAFDDLPDTPRILSRWQLLIIEAKSRDASFINKLDMSLPRVQDLVQNLELEVQKLFLLDPDRWLARDDLGADDDNNVDDDDDDDLEMQEVAAHLSKCSSPDSLVHSLADRVDELDISDLPTKLSTCDPQPSNECSSNAAAENVNVIPQRPRKQRSLKKYVYQAIAECLALHLAPKPERFQENILKFCVSSSEDWIFGVIDCTDDNHRPCYITDTLTYKIGYENNAIKFNDFIALLMIWMCVPAEELLPYMEKCPNTS